jgi:hypothetical protein
VAVVVGALPGPNHAPSQFEALLYRTVFNAGLDVAPAAGPAADAVGRVAWERRVVGQFNDGMPVQEITAQITVGPAAGNTEGRTFTIQETDDSAISWSMNAKGDYSSSGQYADQKWVRTYRNREPELVAELQAAAGAGR